MLIYFFPSLSSRMASTFSVPETTPLNDQLRLNSLGFFKKPEQNPAHRRRRDNKGKFHFFDHSAKKGQDSRTNELGCQWLSDIGKHEGTGDYSITAIPASNSTLRSRWYHVTPMLWPRYFSTRMPHTSVMVFHVKNNILPHSHHIHYFYFFALKISTGDNYSGHRFIKMHLMPTI